MTNNDFYNIYLSELNEQQLKACRQVEGACLLLAVPGSGKTTVLIKRLGYMINCFGINPKNILVITYTVNAANDMKERYIKYFGEENSEDIEFRTINGICAKILYKIERKYNRSLYDLASENQIIAILSKIYRDINNSYPTENDLKNIRTQITYIKNMMLSDDEIQSDFLPVYKSYLEVMNEKKLMDYDDQMRYALSVLKSMPDELNYYQERYKYICVDEAQDTSKIQHEIIKLLSKKYNNIFMVGDEDQSIYGFRAAYPDALLNFKDDYKNATILLMETNYRSNANIVEASNDFINKNKFRYKKKMKASKEKLSNIEIIKAFSREHQYDEIVKKIKGNPKKQIAVLYRNNESVIPLIDRFDYEKISYSTRNTDTLFFTNRIVTDICYFILFAQNQSNEKAFMNIYYKMEMFMSKEMAVSVCQKAKESNNSIMETIINSKELPDFIIDRAKELSVLFNRISKVNAKTVINLIKYRINYIKYLSRTEDSNKLDKLDLLEVIANRCSSGMELIERLNYLKNKIENPNIDESSNVILTTIHSSKGLEYDDVFIIDVIDGIFPDRLPNKDIKQIKEYEEERRLFYVGMTRAINNLFVFKIPAYSTFINEIEKYINCDKELKNKKEKIRKIKEKPQISYEEFCELLYEDVKVNHQKFGNGKITDVSDNRVGIIFDGAVAKQIFNIKVLYSLNVLTFI